MESLDKRISRILGQMRGIQKMVKEQRDSTSVLQQVSAVKKAIDGLTREIILLYLADLVPEDKKKEVDKKKLEQKEHRKQIREIFHNTGFKQLSTVSDKEFTFKERQGNNRNLMYLIFQLFFYKIST